MFDPPNFINSTEASYDTPTRKQIRTSLAIYKFRHGIGDSELSTWISDHVKTMDQKDKSVFRRWLARFLADTEQNKPVKEDSIDKIFDCCRFIRDVVNKEPDDFSHSLGEAILPLIPNILPKVLSIGPMQLDVTALSGPYQVYSCTDQNMADPNSRLQSLALLTIQDVPQASYKIATETTYRPSIGSIASHLSQGQHRYRLLHNGLHLSTGISAITMLRNQLTRGLKMYFSTHPKFSRPSPANGRMRALSYAFSVEPIFHSFEIHFSKIVLVSTQSFISSPSSIETFIETDSTIDPAVFPSSTHHDDQPIGDMAFSTGPYQFFSQEPSGTVPDHQRYLRAAYEGDLHLVQQLIDENAWPDQPDEHTGLTALHIAAGTNNLELVDYLLDTVKLDIKSDAFSRFPSTVAIECQADPDIIDRLISVEDNLDI